MAADHVFIDSAGSVFSGKDLMLKAWQDFFQQYPDYQNHFSSLETRGNEVIVVGFSTCSFEPLAGPALWTARVSGGLVAEWRVYIDTPENRKKMNLGPRSSFVGYGTIRDWSSLYL